MIWIDKDIMLVGGEATDVATPLRSRRCLHVGSSQSCIYGHRGIATQTSKIAVVRGERFHFNQASRSSPSLRLTVFRCTVHQFSQPNSASTKELMNKPINLIIAAGLLSYTPLSDAASLPDLLVPGASLQVGDKGF